MGRILREKVPRQLSISALFARIKAGYGEANHNPQEATLYLGIDWTEIHRTEAPRKNWAPYLVEFPLCDEPYYNKIGVVKALEAEDIEIPRLYNMDFAHNNCGGFCVRGGQGHFANLLKHKPELFGYHEHMEREFRKFIEKDVAILKRQRNNVVRPFTLEELRVEIETEGVELIDLFDIGGCGCFVSEEE